MLYYARWWGVEVRHVNRASGVGHRLEEDLDEDLWTSCRIRIVKEFPSEYLLQASRVAYSHKLKTVQIVQYRVLYHTEIHITFI